MQFDNLSPKRKEICEYAVKVQEAKTRYRHQGRNPEVSLDCAGLVIACGKYIGCIPQEYEYSRYGRLPVLGEIHKLLIQMGDVKNKSDILPGDVVELNDIGYQWPCHMGIVVPGTKGRLDLIHAYLRVGRVARHGYAANWEDQTVAVFQYKGIDD